MLTLMLLAALARPTVPPPGAVPLPAGVRPAPGEPAWYVPLPKRPAGKLHRVGIDEWSDKGK
jgi:hypothetical protein